MGTRDSARAIAAVLAVAASLLCSCEEGTGSSRDGGDSIATDGVDADGSETVDDVPADPPADETPGPSGWIGSPCDSAADCDYDSSVCIAGAPGGMCSLECDMYCPDLDGYPMTFCVDVASLPPEAGGFVEGACFSRCDYGFFPLTGCREGYGCVQMPRANDPGTEVGACVPGAESPPLTPCEQQLAALGVSFEPTTQAPEHPSTHPDLTCTIEDPVILHPPILGVDVDSPSGETPGILASCAMALALVETVEDVAARGVVRVSHLGTYSCRIVSGTDTLSRHAFGDAIDLAGFELPDGTVYTLAGDWEHDTETPVGPGGRFLHEAAHRWYEAWIWNVILTPNYNSDHDDHFHVDLEPASHFMGALPGGVVHYMGPAPYDD